MKFEHQRASFMQNVFYLRRNFVALAFMLCVGLTVHGAQQTDSPTQNPQNPLTQKTVLPITRTPRERRAAAYAKLLEGQRLLAELRRGGSNAERVRAVQSAFKEAAELDPTLSEAHTALADVALYLLEDVGQAEREATLAEKINRDNLGAHRLLARLYTLKSNFNEKEINRVNAERAIAEWRDVVRLRDADAEAWALMGELYDATGHTREAVDAFTKWTASPQPIDPRFYQAVMQRELSPAAAFARLAEVSLKAGRKDEGLAAIRRASELEPDNIAYLELLTRLLSAQGKYDEAVASIRARMKGKATDYFNYLLLSNTLTDAGRNAESVAAAKKAVELAPATQPRLVTQALLMLSSAQERAGDFKGAESSLQRILDKDPSNPTALNNLGYFLVERNERLPEALAMIERAVRSEPDNASFLDSLGWAHFKIGNLEEAERYMTEAVKRNPQSSTLQDHLGDILSKSGKTELARVAWRKSLELSSKPGDAERLKAKIDGQTR